MEKLVFKTNINCNSCLAKITPALDNSIGAGNWSVDITNPAKLLTVKAENISEKNLVDVIEAAGYKAAKLQ